MKISLSALGALAITITSIPSLAQDTSNTKKAPAVKSDELSAKGFYATAAAGFIAPNNVSTTLTQLDSPYSQSGTTSQNTSFSGEFGLGYDFGPVRTEITYGYTPISSNVSSFTESYGSATYTYGQPLGSSVNLSTILLSAYYDIQTKSRFTPYLGGGIGPGFAVAQQRTLYADSCTGCPGSYSNSIYFKAQNTTVLAYQLKIGVSYAASRKADLFAEAGYLGFGGYSQTLTDSSGGDYLQVDFGSNGGFVSKLGFRYRFGK